MLMNKMNLILVISMLALGAISIGLVLFSQSEDPSKMAQTIMVILAITLTAILVLQMFYAVLNYLDKRPRLFVGVLIFIASMLIGMLVFSGFFPSDSNLNEPQWDIVLLLSSITGLTLSIAWGMYFHALGHNRRAVAWATAFALFGPLFAGLAYLLTWPKQTD
jgi:hypothetical protein